MTIVRVLALVGVLLLGPPAAWADAEPQPYFQFRPAYGDVELAGAAKAKGAVIWSHGRGRLTEPTNSVPFYTDALRDAGWDVFVLQRRWDSDSLRESSAALGKEVDALHRQGYRRVVLAGQSFGAWLSFIVAAQRDDIHAVVATAPAAYGRRDIDTHWQLNAANLYKIAERLRGARTMVFMFDNDPFDPGGRGERLAQILDQRGVGHAIIDRPAGFTGHGVAQTAGFARRFAPCILAFVEAPRPDDGFSCDRFADFEPPPFPGPEQQKIVPPPRNAAPGLAAFSGRWYGHFEDGREIMLTVGEIGVDRVIAVFAWRVAVRAPKERGGFWRRHGTYDPKTQVLSFTELNRPPMTYKLREDGVMETTLTAKSGSTSVSGTLRRVK